MQLKSINGMLVVAIMMFVFSSCQNKKKPSTNKSPNIVLIFTDDQGYADLGCFGSATISTPNIDKLAKNGMKFTDFHVSSSTCTPSRASLLTGSYPDRVSLPNVLFPNGAWGSNPNIGINPDEETIAELLKEKGYATAMAGKWHLGHKEKFLPTQHGFDQYLGVPFSNDMTIEPTMTLADDIQLRNGISREMIAHYEELEIENKSHYTPLMRNNEVMEFPADQSTLTKRYTEFSLDFIKEKAGESPFFLYLAHTMPHIPIYASENFAGKSEGGLYGDVIEEIDWSVGEIVEALKESGILHNTLVIFTSDNGPWLSYGNHGGSAGSLRGGKFDAWEGGFRVPAVISWPGVVPKGVTNGQLATTLDILPTLVEATGANYPAKKIDGQSILPLLKGEKMEGLEQRCFYYFGGQKVKAVRKGKWKYIVPHKGRAVVEPGLDGVNGESEDVDYPEALYNLEKDITESENLLADYPEIARELKEAGKSFEATIHNEARPVGVYEPMQGANKN